MFCSRSLNHKINRLHQRSLGIAYNDYTTAFEDLLAKAKTVTIHQRNLRVLAIEMYKIAIGLSPNFTIDLLTDLGSKRSTKSNCNVTIDEKENITCSNKSYFCPPRVKTVKFGLNTFRSLGPRIWRLVPDELKAIKSLNVSKEKIKSFEFKDCPYNLCKDYTRCP